MSSSRFINAFLYPDFTAPTDIRFVFNPFDADSDDSCSNSTTTSDDDVLSEENKLGCEISDENYAVSSKYQEKSPATEANSLENNEDASVAAPVSAAGERLFPRVSFSAHVSSDSTTSPLDDMDLIDIILKHGVHRELKSLTFRKECVQEPPSLSPVKECSDDVMTLPGSKMLHFDMTVLETIRSNSLGCYMGKNWNSKSVIPVDGLTCGLYLLYAEAKNKYHITSCKFYATLDVVESRLTLINEDEKDIGEPIGVAFASSIFSENTPSLILELAKSKLKALTRARIEFLTFIDVMSENLMMECFEHSSNSPMLFNLVDGNR